MKPNVVFGAAFSSVTFGSLVETASAASFLDKSAKENDESKESIEVENHSLQETAIESSSEDDAEEVYEPQTHSDETVSAAKPQLQPVALLTGEENEECIFNCKVKAFFFDKKQKEWKERGVGMCKVNVHTQNKDMARLLVRHELTKKVLVNSRIDEAFVPVPVGDTATFKALRFMTLEPSELADEPPLAVGVLLRCQNHEMCASLRAAIAECKL